MDPDAGTQFLGLFIAAQPLAQLFFSPLMGFLGNRMRSVRILSMISCLLLAAGFSMYAYISALPEPRRWFLFSSRFLIGAAAGAITLCFSYLAEATTIKERTTAVSLFQMAQSVAFVLGPVIQSAFAPLGTGNNLPLLPDGDLYLNIFTGPSWLSAGLAMLNLFLLMPGCFTEFDIARREGDYLAGQVTNSKTQSNSEQRPPDRLALVVCIIIFSAVQFNFVFLERYGSKLIIM